MKPSTPANLTAFARIGRNTLRSFAAGTLAVMMIATAMGCDQTANDPEMIEAPAYTDGAMLLSDGGVFSVEMWSEEGEARVGDNSFVLRVCLADTDQGVPGAELDFAATMPDGESEGDTAVDIEYVGDGQYVVDGVMLDRPGTWQFDVDIHTSRDVTESVRIAFRLTD